MTRFKDIRVGDPFIFKTPTRLNKYYSIYAKTSEETYADWPPSQPAGAAVPTYEVGSIDVEVTVVEDR